MEATEAIRGAKSPEAFRTISEASSELGLPQHVLRFWETKFSFIRPMKRAGGRRFYRPQDIAVLKGVRTLLHEGGYTIKGVQRLHKEYGTRALVGAGEGDIPPPAASMREVEIDDRIPSEQADIADELFKVSRAEPIARPALRVGDTAILRTGARIRLDAVLRDIEQAKAAIDRLLAERDD